MELTDLMNGIKNELTQPREILPERFSEFKQALQKAQHLFNYAHKLRKEEECSDSSGGSR